MDRPVRRGVRPLQGSARRRLRHPFRVPVARPECAARRARASQAWRPAIPCGGAYAAPDSAGAIRSTGASLLLKGQGPALQALAASTFVADCTLEGLMHAAELPAILKDGARVLYVSNEHPEALARLAPSPADEQQVRAAMRRLREARQMKVASPAGTALSIRVEGARVGGVWGYTEKPGTLSHWPGGLWPVLPAGGKRQRHPGDGAGRPEPHFQAGRDPAGDLPQGRAASHHLRSPRPVARDRRAHAAGCRQRRSRRASSAARASPPCTARSSS